MKNQRKILIFTVTLFFILIMGITAASAASTNKTDTNTSYTGSSHVAADTHISTEKLDTVNKSKTTTKKNLKQSGNMYYISTGGSSGNSGRSSSDAWSYGYGLNTLKNTKYNNSEVYIQPGTYYVNSTVTFNKKTTLTIRGNGNVILDGSGDTACFNIVNGKISINGIEFINFRGNTGGAIHNTANNTMISVTLF